MAGTATEARHPSAEGLHRIPASEALGRLLAAQAAALTAVEPAQGALAAAGTAAIAALNGGGKLAYAGAGSSGLMALADCLELAGTFGLSPDRTPILFAGGAAALLHMQGGVEDEPALAEQDFTGARMATGDVVICVSASGSTPYTLEIARLARDWGVTVVGIANVPGCALLAASDIPVLLETGAEVVAGSTRMGAATAQKAALNMFSTLVGIGLGHVHDGHMVNLVADNAKLRERAARMVAELSGASDAASRDALAATEGAVKLAVLVARGASPDQAAEDLQRTAGHLAPLL